MEKKMTVAIACDHAGPEAKNEVKGALCALGYTVIDHGCDTTESVNYPDYETIEYA